MLINNKIVSFLIIFFVSFSAISSEINHSEIEQKFIRSQQLIALKQYKQSSQILKEISEITNALRLKLEYARSLYLEKNYKESKKIFEEVYFNKETPYQVKATIAKYLKEIDNRIGYLNFNISLVSEENPGNDPGSGTYNIFGFIPLNYNSQGEDTKTIYGGLGEINAGKKLNDNLILRTNLRLRSFGKSEYSQHDRDEVNVVLRYQPLKHHFYAEPSYYIHKKENQDYNISSGKIGFAKLYENFFLDYNRSFGYRDFDQNKSLNSDIWTDSLTIVTGEFFNSNVSLSYIKENNNAKNDLNSFNSDTIHLGIEKKLFNNRFIINPSYQITKSDYDKFDGFWYQKRNDEIENLRLGICDRNLRIFGRYICLTASKINSASNINFYSYDSSNIMFTLRKE